MEHSFFTTLQAGWLNAWILSFGMVLIQFSFTSPRKTLPLYRHNETYSR